MDKTTEALINSLERYYALYHELQQSCRHILNAQEPYGFRGPRDKADINLAGRKDIAFKTLKISEEHRLPFYSQQSPALAAKRTETLEKEDRIRAGGVHVGTQIGNLWQQRKKLEVQIVQSEVDALIRMAEGPRSRETAESRALMIPDPATTILALKTETRELLTNSGKVSLVTHFAGDDRKLFCNGQRSSRTIINRIISKPRQAEWKKQRGRADKVRQAASKGIPLYESSFASTQEMTAPQRSFYRRWVREWRKGRPIEVAGQTSYVFCYLKEQLKEPWRRAAEELLRVCAAYGSESPSLAYACRAWASDCFVMVQDYAAAVKVLPEPPLETCFSKLADNRMSLKLALQQEADGRDLLLLEGPNVTSWGRDNLSDVVRHMDATIEGEHRSRERTLLEEWAESTWNRMYSVFDGTSLRFEPKIRGYAFSREVFVLDYVRALTHEAENKAREERGVPLIGEGWVSETALYYAIKGALPEYDVIPHASPEWLTPQHLDVFVADLSVAIEYQGEQHDRPIDFFGGKEGHESLRRRDARKRKLCKANGVRLLYVREGFELSELIDEIRHPDP